MDRYNQPQIIVEHGETASDLADRATELLREGLQPVSQPVQGQDGKWVWFWIFIPPMPLLGGELPPQQQQGNPGFIVARANPSGPLR